jgi:hypothetical protein
MRTLGRALIACTLLAACGGDDDGGITAGGLTIEEYCAAQATFDQAWRGYLDGCCSAEDKTSTNYLPAFGDLAFDATGCATKLRERLAAGSIRWDGNHAQECLDQMAARIPAPPASCVGTGTLDALGAYRDQPPERHLYACLGTVIGQRQEGEACDYHSDCASGLSCQGPSPYTCAPVTDQYGACDHDEDCEIDLHCVHGLCGYLASELQPCTFDEDCEDGLMCSYSDEACYLPVPAGYACASSSECAVGTSCDLTLAIPRCVAHGQDGAGCSYDIECQGRCSGGTCVSICGGTWY